ncbi:MAG: hypothetical protein PHO74_04510 [Weeksellaceae bacterium]|nr:hypothetical protein [Weeksellaceae bacterium]
MRVFGFVFVLMLISGSFRPFAEDYILLGPKTFSVKGSTSIGKYDCDYKLDTKDTLYLNQKIGINYKIPVKKFGCGNFLLTGDFRKTLKEKQYPWVFITVSDVRKEGQLYRYNLRLDLAGKVKHMKNLKLRSEKGGLKGEIELKFSDFDLEAPNKLGGAIKVKEEISLLIDLKTL